MKIDHVRFKQGTWGVNLKEIYHYTTTYLLFIRRFKLIYLHKCRKFTLYILFNVFRGGSGEFPGTHVGPLLIYLQANQTLILRSSIVIPSSHLNFLNTRLDMYLIIQWLIFFRTLLIPCVGYMKFTCKF